MTDRPILFSAPMVRALLDGHKTQTRRIIMPKPVHRGIQSARPAFNSDNTLSGWNWWLDDALLPFDRIKLKCMPGDRLWVREGWRVGAWQAQHYARSSAECSADIAVDYLADNFARKEWLQGKDDDAMMRLMDQSREDAKRDGRFEQAGTFQYKWSPGQSPCRKRPSIHMPRWASRLTLTVTDVRVQRLQDISRGDAMSEGCPFPNMATGPDPRQWYAELWNQINGPGAWDANPWVAAYSFTVHRGNIDQ